jgi:hypothetical protein
MEALKAKSWERNSIGPTVNESFSETHYCVTGYTSNGERKLAEQAATGGQLSAAGLCLHNEPRKPGGCSQTVDLRIGDHVKAD